MAAEREPSFEVFFEAERDRLYGSLCLLTGDTHDAEEIAQDAFLALWQRWRFVRTGAIGDPVGYLYRTAMNQFRTRLRRRRLAIRRSAAPTESPDEWARASASRTVLGALASLAPRQRAAIVLMELLDYSSEEAGRVLGVRAGTVRALAHQGRTALRRAMEDPDE